MSGGVPPNYYGFVGGAPNVPLPGVPSAQFSYPGVPVAFPNPQLSAPGAPPTYFHPPQYMPVSQTVSNYFPSGETHFTNASVTPLNTSIQAPRWVHWQKGMMLPAHAVEAGYDIDRTKIYVGRLNHKGDLLPAKVIPEKSVAYVCYGGNEIAYFSCEILCRENANWERCSNGRIPPGALPVGRTSTGESLYAGRVHHNGSLTVGKVHPSHGCCYIPFNGKEISHRDYDVLI